MLNKNLLKHFVVFGSILMLFGCGKRESNPIHKIMFFYTDLDGTLLEKDDNVSQKNMEAVRNYIKSGGKIGIATGRLPIHARAIAKKINPHLPIISANGAYIETVEGKVLRIKSIEQNDKINGLCQQIKNAGCKMYYTAFVELKTGKVSFNKSVCRLPQKGVGILKIRAKKCTDQGVLFNRLKAKYGNEFSIVESGHDEYKGISIAPGGVDKGEAMEWVCNKLGINMKKLAFIGDSGNDISGLEMVKSKGGKCFAMKNGTEKLKKICENITRKDNVNHGVGVVLKELIK